MQDIYVHKVQVNFKHVQQGSNVVFKKAKDKLVLMVIIVLYLKINKLKLFYNNNLLIIRSRREVFSNKIYFQDFHLINVQVKVFVRQEVVNLYSVLQAKFQDQRMFMIQIILELDLNEDVKLVNQVRILNMIDV